MNLNMLKTMKLSRRERSCLVLCAVAVFLFLLFQFAIFPFADARERTKRSITRAESTLRDLAVLSAEYRSLGAASLEVDRLIKDRPKDFSLFSFLEQQAGEVGIKPNISYMRPSETIDQGSYRESSVEMRLENITMSQLVEYLRRVESEEHLVRVRRIVIKRTEVPRGCLSVLIQLVTVV